MAHIVDKDVFVYHLLSGDPATTAYTKAGGKAESRASIASAASKLKKHPQVQQMLQEGIQDQLNDRLLDVMRLTPLAITTLTETLEAEMTDKNKKDKLVAAQRVLDVADRYAPKKMELDINTTSTQVVSVDTAVAELMDMMNGRQDLRSQFEKIVEGKSFDVIESGGDNEPSQASEDGCLSPTQETSNLPPARSDD